MTVKTVEDHSEDSHSPSERRGYQAWTQQLPPGKFRTIISKLFTNEDNLQIHKTLGILSVISFFYRYFYVYPTTGTLGFNGSWFDHLTMGIHLSLSASALLFHVIKARLLSRPMIIWEEYRLHAIIFSTRCMSVYLMGYFRPFAGTIWERILLPMVVLAHHVGADMVTAKYGSKDATTVRVKDDHRPDIKSVLRFYAFYQFTALASHVVPNARLMDLGFNTYIAIQSSAFLMTLYRKGVFSEFQHAFGYAACLLVSLYHIFLNCGSAVFIAKLALAYILRTEFKTNKYFLWTSFAYLAIPEVETFLVSKLLEVLGMSAGVTTLDNFAWACGNGGVLNHFCNMNASSIV